VPSRGHSAHIEPDVVVHYRWHPLYGQHVRRHYSEQRATGEFVYVEAASGVVVVVAAWMLDPVACAGMAMGVPRVSLAALNDLHRLLVTYGSERSSADDATVVQEEQDEAVSTKPARTPTAPGTRFRQASWDEPKRAQQGIGAAGPAAARGRKRRDGGACR